MAFVYSFSLRIKAFILYSNTCNNNNNNNNNNNSSSVITDNGQSKSLARNATVCVF